MPRDAVESPPRTRIVHTDSHLLAQKMSASGEWKTCARLPMFRKTPPRAAVAAAGRV